MSEKATQEEISRAIQALFWLEALSSELCWIPPLKGKALLEHVLTSELPYFIKALVLKRK